MHRSPDPHEASMSFTLMLYNDETYQNMLENVGRCRKTNWIYLDHCQLKQMNHTPVPSIACDRIDCCIALPGDGCAFTTSLKKLEQVKAEICANATQQQSISDNITLGMWVIIQMSATQEPYVYIYIYIYVLK